jgi:ankyrin repeat protein
MSAPELTADEVDFLLEVVDLARNGDAGALAGAIESGVPVNLTNAAGDTLLILAAYHCHLDIVEMLLERGADCARVNDRGQTALAAATFRRNRSMVTALLAAGADPDAGERSARQIATFFNLADMMVLLNDVPQRLEPEKRLFLRGASDDN